MDIIFNAILSWFSSLAGRFLGDMALRFIAYKLLFFTLITVTVPIVSKNLVTWLFRTVTQVASAHINTDGLQATVLHLTGLAGYIASHLMLADCLSIIITAITIRLVLNFIPFIG